MRLDELVGVKHLAGKTPAEVLTWLQAEFDVGKSKLRVLGKGSNAVALTNGKIAFKFWKLDSAYEKFVKFCLQNQENPFLPKFKSNIRVLPRLLTQNLGFESNSVRYVKIELLEPYEGEGGFTLFLDPEIEKEVNADKKNHDLANFIDFDTLLQWAVYFGLNDAQNVKYLLQDLMTEYLEFKAPYLKYAEHLNPELIEFLRTLGGISNVSSEFDRFDPGERNLALRGSQVVILDPIVNDDDLELNLKLLKIF